MKIGITHWKSVKGLIIEMKDGRIFHFGINFDPNNVRMEIKTFDVPENTHINAVRCYHKEFIDDVQFTTQKAFQYEYETSLTKRFEKSLIGLPGYEKCRLKGIRGAVVRGKVGQIMQTDDFTRKKLMDGSPFISKLQFTFEYVE